MAECVWISAEYFWMCLNQCLIFLNHDLMCLNQCWIFLNHGWMCLNQGWIFLNHGWMCLNQGWIFLNHSLIFLNHIWIFLNCIWMFLNHCLFHLNHKVACLNRCLNVLNLCLNVPKAAKIQKRLYIKWFRPIQTCFSKYSEGDSDSFRHEIFIRVEILQKYLPNILFEIVWGHYLH